MRPNYTRNIEILRNYAENEGFRVNLNYSHISTINWVDKSLNEPKSIGINKDYNDEMKSYIFLHELGHHELRKNWNEFKERLPILAIAEEKLQQKDNKYKRRDAYVICSLEEEYLAWSEGLALGRKLGLDIDLDNFIKIKTSSIKSYIKYYSNIKK